MSEAIKNLQPQLLWQLFAEIAAIPHGSGNESALSVHFKNRAEAAGFTTRQDAVGNLCIVVPATAGLENAPTVVLQGHIDMVCEKNSNVVFNFLKDGIRLVRDGDWLKADGTTLGADNGIGVAAGLAVALDPNVKHGPLEILLTIDEESGLTGARGLSPDLLTGRILLNLDSEETNVLFIGCAGGGGVDSRYPVFWVETPQDFIGAELNLFGLRGGHSGIDIIENRGNAIKLLARILSALQPLGIAIADFQSGDKHNAIPREGTIRLALPKASYEAAKKLVTDQLAVLRLEFSRETELNVMLTETTTPAKVFAPKTQSGFIDLLLAYPNGVAAMSMDLKGIVETSNNLASANLKDNEVLLHNSPRSSIDSALRALTKQILAIGRMAGAADIAEEPYPGWKPNPDSPILRLVTEVHQKLFGIDPKPMAIHAGLECGIIGEKFAGMDMISFGPDIRNPHSPDERVNIPSVGKFWQLLTAVLHRIASGN